MNGEWIKTTDTAKLPPEDKLVLCAGAKKGLFIGYICAYAGYIGDSLYVNVPNSRKGRFATHWQELPPLPE